VKELFDFAQGLEPVETAAGLSNTDHQHPKKLQAPIVKIARCPFRAWRIEVSLELGCWNLEL
jgi:hypothetical protein